MANYCLHLSRRIAGGIAALLLMSLACAFSQPSADTMSQLKTITATQEDNGDTVQVARDDSLVIQLDFQPGTGYSWQIVRHDTTHLRLLDEEWLGSEQGMEGGGELQVFRFAVLKADSSLVEMHYKRPWEKEEPPQGIYRLRVEKP